jgi:membrane protein YdbS with pleckstrin-like domain
MPAMICQNCKSEAADDAVYCPKCGDRLDRRMTPGGGFEREQDVDKTAPISSDVTAAASGADRLRGKVQENRFGEVAEEELWQGGYSSKAMIGSWIGAGLLSVILLIVMILVQVLLMSPIAWAVFAVVLVLIWGGLGAMLVYRRMEVHYQLTSQRFIHRSGVLRRSSDRIEVIDIDDVTYEQGLVERMVGVGTIKITSSDRSHPELSLYGIDNVAQVADVIDTVRRAERRRRGVHIEAI